MNIYDNFGFFLILNFIILIHMKFFKFTFSCQLKFRSISTHNIQSIAKNLENLNILLVGEGDFSFASSLSKLGICHSLLATTFESKPSLLNAYPHSEKNIAEILENNGKVIYEVDGTKLSDSNLFDYDTIIWNFPHIAGKTNNRYNRQLLQSFFKSAKNSIKPNGTILISLCQDQSGIESHNKIAYDYSWKLIEQASEAGLLVTKKYVFQSILGYKPMGHRGRGGTFDITNSSYYELNLPFLSSTSTSMNSNNKNNCIGIQAALYSHEIKVLCDCKLVNYKLIEKQIKQAIIELSIEHNFADYIWSIHLEDSFQPQIDKISYGIEISYCNVKQPLSREKADLFRIIIEQNLSKKIEYE